VKADAERARRLLKKQAREQEPPTDNLETRRCSAIIRLLEQCPGPQPVRNLVDGLKRSKAFVGLTDKTRRNAILRLVSGKLRELLVVTSGRAKNRKPTLVVELRK